MILLIQLILTIALTLPLFLLQYHYPSTDISSHFTAFSRIKKAIATDFVILIAKLNYYCLNIDHLILVYYNPTYGAICSQYDSYFAQLVIF